MLDVGKYEKRLLDRLNELNDRLESIEEDLDEPADPDAEERATEREGDEVLESLGNAGLMEIKMIQAALARVRDGTFGVCVNCGEAGHFAWECRRRPQRPNYPMNNDVVDYVD